MLCVCVSVLLAHLLTCRRTVCVVSRLTLTQAMLFFTQMAWWWSLWSNCWWFEPHPVIVVWMHECKWLLFPVFQCLCEWVSVTSRFVAWSKVKTTWSLQEKNPWLTQEPPDQHKLLLNWRFSLLQPILVPFLHMLKFWHAPLMSYLDTQGTI